MNIEEKKLDNKLIFTLVVFSIISLIIFCLIGGWKLAIGILIGWVLIIPLFFLIFTLGDWILRLIKK